MRTSAYRTVLVGLALLIAVEAKNAGSSSFETTNSQEDERRILRQSALSGNQRQSNSEQRKLGFDLSSLGQEDTTTDSAAKEDPIYDVLVTLHSGLGSRFKKSSPVDSDPKSTDVVAKLKFTKGVGKGEKKTGKGGAAKKGKGKEKKSSKFPADLSDVPSIYPTFSDAPSSVPSLVPFACDGDVPPKKGKKAPKVGKGGKGSKIPKESKGKGAKKGKGGGKGKTKGSKGGDKDNDLCPDLPDTPSLAPSGSIYPTYATPKKKSKKGKEANPPTCAPTSGSCVSTLSALQAELLDAATGAIITICDRSAISTTSVITINEDEITLCCEGLDCTLSSDGTDAVLFVDGASVTLEDLRFVNGYSPSFNGGNVAIQGDGNHTIRRSEFVNGVTNETGGNLFVLTKGSLNIEDSTFIDGKARRAGGGLAVLDAKSVNITNTLFRANDAANGGAFFWNVGEGNQPDSQSIDLKNSVFIENLADIGAAFFLFADFQQELLISIENNDFNNNEATAVGGIGSILYDQDLTTILGSRNNGAGNIAQERCNDIFLNTTSSGICLDVDTNIDIKP